MASEGVEPRETERYKLAAWESNGTIAGFYRDGEDVNRSGLRFTRLVKAEDYDALAEHLVAERARLRGELREGVEALWRSNSANFCAFDVLALVDEVLGRRGGRRPRSALRSEHGTGGGYPIEGRAAACPVLRRSAQAG